MAWNVNGGKQAIDAAMRAEDSAERAESASEYIEEKKPLIDEFTGKQTNLQTQLNDLVLQKGTDIAEVVQARGGEVTLNTRLNKVTTQLADTANEVTTKADAQTTSTALANLELAKATKAYVLEKTQATNVQWKMSFATLSELQTTYATGDIYNHVVLADGYIYTWHNDAWGSTQISANTRDFTDQTVEPRHTTFFEQSTNLLDETIVTANKNILANGTISDSAAYSLYGPYNCKPTTDYSFAGVTNVAWFNASGAFISRVPLNSPVENYAGVTVKSPSTARTMYVSKTIHEGNDYGKQINESSNILPYEPFYISLDNNVLKDGGLPLKKVDLNVFQSKTLDGGVLKDKSVSLDHIDFIGTSNNLFNPSLVLKGYSLSKDGTIAKTDSGYDILDFTPVKPSTAYSFKGFNLVVWYNSAHVRIAHTEYSYTSTSWENVISPSNAAYMRVRWQPVIYGEKNQQFNEGSTLLDYDRFGEPSLVEDISLSNSSTIKDIYNEIRDISTVVNAGRELIVDFDCPSDGVFSSNESYEGFTNFGNVTAAEVYAMYDALVTSYPDYISKTALGNDMWGNPIAYYTFNPVLPASSENYRLPEIGLTLGTHGYEHMPPLSVYHMLKLACEKTYEYPLLQVLRFNAVIKVIPIVNPSGWNAYTRKNGNGIDINRSMPFGFVVGSDTAASTYGGTEPLIELESQYIKTFLDTNLNLDYLFDYHNFHEVEVASQFLWIPMHMNTDAPTKNIARNLVAQMSRKWARELDFLTDDGTFYGYSDAGTSATISAYATSRGLISTTFEGRYRWLMDSTSVAYDHNSIKCNVEAFTNYLLMHLRYSVLNK